MKRFEVLLITSDAEALRVEEYHHDTLASLKDDLQTNAIDDYEPWSLTDEDDEQRDIPVLTDDWTDWEEQIREWRCDQEVQLVFRDNWTIARLIMNQLLGAGEGQNA